ncbi:Na/Pi cotransporter family protein [Pseudovibrio sp. Tun.PSC04-5.I4]|uniref:Na/Pi cotransporter family protein n=1 Tax=Pseudovibrio sp. Tun.PSC04-5.I4 TaxID=1798213 RepID=UPI00088A45C3|nr:Na/Pi cotransporter family protein [Pseudovibrio sp. Tun.PSC04-5.I4]SDQ22900.1 phosphate:Na+ symporter [Pseudovibrio sp. Tun.PSC04-5.I4]
MSSFEILLYLAAGISLLFWATRMIRTGVERAIGQKFQGWMQQASKNRYTSFTTGLLVSIILQSATATAILARGFISKGTITLAAGLAIMLGADLGSTMVVQVLSLDLSWLLPVCLVVGGALFSRGSTRTMRQSGRIIIGIGQMLIALSFISMASTPLRESGALPVILNLLIGDPFIAIITAAALTWLLHSSVAVVLMIMTLASTGVLPLEGALLFVLGANIGSSIIPLVLTMNDSADVRRVPVGNMIFRVAGVLIALLLMKLDLLSADMLGADPARAIANFHSGFNLAVVLLGIPTISIVARLTKLIISDHAGEQSDDLAMERLSLLDRKLLQTPDLAFSAATREMLHMSEKVEAMLRGVMVVFREEDPHTARRLMKMDDEIDDLHISIKEYLTDVTTHSMSEVDYQKYTELMNYCVCLEQMGDVVQRNLLVLAEKMSGLNKEFSKEGWREIQDLHAAVLQNLQISLRVLITRDPALARDLVARKVVVRELEYKSREAHLRRLTQNRQSSRTTSSIHLETISDLKYLNALLTTVAYPIVEGEGELLRSRLTNEDHGEQPALRPAST